MLGLPFPDRVVDDVVVEADVVELNYSVVPQPAQPVQRHPDSGCVTGAGLQGVKVAGKGAGAGQVRLGGEDGGIPHPVVALIVRGAGKGVVVGVLLEVPGRPVGPLHRVFVHRRRIAVGVVPAGCPAPGEPVDVAAAEQALEVPGLIAPVAAVEDQKVVRIEVAVGLSRYVDRLFPAAVEEPQRGRVEARQVQVALLEPFGVDAVETVLLHKHLDPGHGRIVPVVDRGPGGWCPPLVTGPGSGLLPVEEGTVEGGSGAPLRRARPLFDPPAQKADAHPQPVVYPQPVAVVPHREKP